MYLHVQIHIHDYGRPAVHSSDWAPYHPSQAPIAWIEVLMSVFNHLNALNLSYLNIFVSRCHLQNCKNTILQKHPYLGACISGLCQGASPHPRSSATIITRLGGGELKARGRKRRVGGKTRAIVNLSYLVTRFSCDKLWEDWVKRFGTSFNCCPDYIVLVLFQDGFRTGWVFEAM